MKGFLGGVSIGTLVAVAGAAMWSLSTPMPARVQVDTRTPGQSVQPANNEASPLLEGQNRDPDLVDAAPNSPVGSVDGDVSPIATVDTEPGNRPEIGAADGVARGDMSEGEVVKNIPNQSLAAPFGQETGEAPQAPSLENDLEVSTATAELPSSADPQVAPTGSHLSTTPRENSNASETGGGTAPSVQATISVPQIGSAPAETPVPNISPLGISVPRSGQVGVSEAQAGSGAATSGGSDAREPDTGETESVSDETDGGDLGAEQQAAASLPTTQATPVDTGPQIGTRVAPLTERARSAQEASEVSATTTTADTGPTFSPFVANSQAYTALGERPLMSIVLIDDAAAIGAEALAEFPYPLTFAIDPDDPKAVEKMQARRDAGFEVLILADLPREASPQDAETSLAVWMDRLPMAVGFLEGVETGFQGNRPLADQMVTALAAAGYGMVTQNSGLNTVQKLALRDGMPSGVVFRDFDGAGQNPRAIRRFLDQAAFRARQEGAVIMLGRLRPETISALLLWGLQDRASQVGLAPISAGLEANLAPDRSDG